MSIPRDDYIGEPEYPSPWTTSTVREGLRDLDDAKIVSLAPDVCLTPVGSSIVPIPYPIMDYCGHDTGYTPSVRFTRKKAMVMRSRTEDVHGDRAGIRKGVKSGSVGDVSEPIGHASQVRAEGSHVIRHLDRFWMNNRNTQGEAIFSRGMQTYDAPVDDDPIPGSLRSGSSQVMSDAYPEPIIMGAEYAAAPQQASAPAPAQTRGALPKPSFTAPPNTAANDNVWRPSAPPTSPQSQSPNPRLGQLMRLGRFAHLLPLLLLPGDTPLIPPLPPGADPVEKDLNKQANDLLDMLDGDHNRRVQRWYQEELVSYQQHRQAMEELEADKHDVNEPLPLSDPVRISRDEYRKKCEVGPYWKMRKICGGYGMKAHHIVPDWTLRYGGRNDNKKRIPNLPSLGAGKSICVVGDASVADTEHNEAHLADADIEAVGRNSSPPGTASLAVVISKSMMAMIDVRKDCYLQITKAIQEQYAGKDPNQILRAIKDINATPLGDDTVKALKSGAKYPWKNGGK